jgi:hypothetical protein
MKHYAQFVMLAAAMCCYAGSCGCDENDAGKACGTPTAQQMCQSRCDEENKTGVLSTNEDCECVCTCIANPNPGDPPQDLPIDP